MSLNTWTHIGLASEAQPWRGAGWRLVEAQHKVATMGLVDHDPDAQAVLEDVLEQSKPALPPDAEGLHWLLATPFRYPPLMNGSRFRKRYEPGVFYGGEVRETACAEAGYWRLRFWCDSEGLRGKSKSMPVTLFRFNADAMSTIDLGAAPFDACRSLWTQSDDYSHTQALATQAREAGVEAIRYESVRHPGGRCLALLTPQVFRRARNPFPNIQQNWDLHLIPPGRVVFQRPFHDESLRFSFA